MDEARVREMLLENLGRSGSDPEQAHAMYHEEAVLEFPQSGERFEGVENFREWRSSYPAATSYEIRRVRGGGNVWVVELEVSYDGAPPMYGVSILEIRDEKIARESIYVAEGWEAPEWRASWRAAP